MISIIDISNFISCMSLAAVFLLLVELKYSKKITIFSISVFIIISFLVFLTLVSKGINDGVASAVSITIPSLIFCLILSKRKGSRFVFTFCTVDIIGFIIIIFSRVVAMPFNDNEILILGVNILGFTFLIFTALKYRENYVQIQRILNSGWRSLAAVSILFYLMIYMIISYPTPMIERREYMPVAVLFSITIIFVYIVIYQTVMKGIRIYNEKQERMLLETEVKLQKSQLELKEVYYKMAYTDILTGLKNRTAFEEKREALNQLTEKSNDLSCLSMDLNNLKEINDLYGHNVGDELIKGFANVLKKTFEDLKEDIYRIGGDEFILFFIDIPYEEVQKKIQSLKYEIQQYNKKNELKVSVAMGLVFMNENNIKDPHTLIISADDKMYQDKKRMKKDA